MVAFVECILNDLLPATHRDVEDIHDLVETVISTRNNAYLSFASRRNLCLAINEHRARSSLPLLSMQAITEQISMYPDRKSLQAYVGTLLEGAEELA